MGTWVLLSMILIMSHIILYNNLLCMHAYTFTSACIVLKMKIKVKFIVAVGW